MKKGPFGNVCKYDYENKCDCSDDDKCGCKYPNNMSHNFTKECFENDDEINLEKLNIRENEICGINLYDEKKKVIEGDVGKA